MQDDEIRRYGKSSGMNQDDALPDVDVEGDFVEAWHLRGGGTKGQEDGYNTNLEDLIALSGSLLPGINNIIGGGKFDDTGQILAFRYNTAGNCQMILYDANSNTYQTIFTDVTDSAGLTLLPLNPQNIVLAILINKTYVVWWAKDLEVGYCNLVTLASGGYGTILPEDFSLLKAPCQSPPTAVYGSDAGQPANYWHGRLPQFAVQYVNADFNFTTWSTRSKRIVAYQENTPTLGVDVGQNNYIIISVNIGSIRNTTINIGRQIGGETVFYIIKSVDRTYITALPNVAVDVSLEIYEAYNPTTNIYSYASYGNEIPIPINPNETDLLYDYIWQANAAEKINGNIIALADWKTLYDRPVIDVTVAAIGYNPNIGIPAGTYADPVRPTGSFTGASGSGAGNHKRNMNISMGGIPRTDDTIIIILADIRNATVTQDYSYTVPLVQNGDLLAVVSTITAKLPAAAFTLNGDGTYTIFFTGDPYFGLQTYSIALFFAGATVSNSISTVLESTSYQLGIELFDYKGRPFPLTTGNNYIVNTPSKAQVNGEAVKITLTIGETVAPVGAVTYQVVITRPQVIKVLDVIGVAINFKGVWNAYTNVPTLAINSGNIGDTYQVTQPDSPAHSAYTNLGNFATYDTGVYVTNVGGSSSAGFGQTYAVLPKNFANLASNQVLCLSLNPLNLFNQDYAQQGVQTVLNYEYAVGDRCTLHYWIDGSGTINYFNNPCIDLAVLGYDATTYIVKVEYSSALTYSSGHILYNGQEIDAKNIFFRLYSPAQAAQSASSVQSTTEWFEVGEQFTITNGLFDTLSIDIFEGGAYYKTRQYPNGILPYQDPPIAVLATDLNYSDFYPSEYYSYGRPRTDFDQLEKTEQKASIITSQNYVLGSKNNGLNRFYPADIYGEGDGQTSSSQEAIQIMWQRGQQLVVIQGLNVFYIPVNQAYTVLNDQLTGQSISEKLLNNGRYATETIGIGTAKESFWKRYNRGGFVDPYKSLPFEITLSGIDPIGKKMSKYFKSVLQPAYQIGKKLYQFYNDYYEEVVLYIQAEGGILLLFPFDDVNWNPNDSFVIVPGDVTATPNGANCTASYNSGTGVVTYTPTPGFVGNNAPTFTFNAQGGPYTKNNCLTWIAGDGVPSNFSFLPLTNQPLSTLLTSNIIGVYGINIATPITITGGQYSINGGSWTSSAGTVVNGDTVQVRQTSSGSSLTETDAILTIGGVSGTFAVTTGDSAPDAFSFTALTNQPLSTVETSNSITVSGITIAAPISVTGGSYSINGGAFVTSAGTVVVGDTVRVRQTSSASESTTTNTVLTIGGVNGTFSVTTGTTAINPFSFTPQTGVALSTVITSNTISPTGNTLPVAISISAGGQYSINGGSFTSTAGTFNPGDSVTVRQTSSASLNTTTSVTLTIGSQTGVFSVKTIAPDATVNWSLTEQASPATFVDADLIIKDNGTTVVTRTSTDSGTFTIAADNVLTSIIRSTVASTGINPQLHMRVYRNTGSGDVLIYTNDIPQTSTSEIDWSGEAAVSGATYTITEWSDSNAVINWSNNQQLTPFIDGDLLIYDITTTYVNETDNNTGTFNAPASDLLHVISSNNITPVGSTTPKLRLQIVDNDGSVFDLTIDATGSVTIPEDVTLKGGYLYTITSTTFDEGGGASTFSISNDTVSTTVNFVSILGSEGGFTLSNTGSGGAQSVPIPSGTDYVVKAAINIGDAACILTVNGVPETLPTDGSVITFTGTFTAPINADAT